MLYQRRCRRLFQSTLPHGSDSGRDTLYVEYYVISILAPSRERLHDILGRLGALHISILAPSRERPYAGGYADDETGISILAPSRERQSCWMHLCVLSHDFNPRSLAGATDDVLKYYESKPISILAPSRERPIMQHYQRSVSQFQSSLPRGSD